MNNIFKTIISVLLCFVLISACSGRNPSARNKTAEQIPEIAQAPAALTEPEMKKILQSLDEIAELERAGSWLQGMALSESSMREQAGDFPGAVAAAYKELALAYGRGLIQKQDVEQGLLNLLDLKSNQSVIDAANAVLAFSRGQWEQAEKELSALFGKEDEPDSFASWMLLVCALEKNQPLANDDYRKASLAYRSIRARYSQFPEYWYRGAKAFSVSGSMVAAEFAENCINSSVQGPFADECRRILAEHTGLKSEDGLSIRTKREIEVLVAQSVNSGDPKILDSLLPLMDLPDNPYTVYAVVALRNLSASPKFREYFSAQASVSGGRLAERLLYISRS